MKINSDISSMTIAVPVVQFYQILALATHHETLRKHLKFHEDKIVRMKHDLTNYQAKFERIKKTSDAGAPVEPQSNKTNADAKTDAVLLTIETEGRVSGGERASICEEDEQ